MAPLMAASVLLATDSGGLQEEGAALGVPVAVLRNVTERPEGLAAGVLKLAGTDGPQVRSVLLELLGNQETLAQMRRAKNPYGDGHAGRAHRAGGGLALRAGGSGLRTGGSEGRPLRWWLAEAA